MVYNKVVANNLLKRGAVGVFPTDTVYGLVCRAHDKTAVERLFGQIKPRENKPGTVIAANIDQLTGLGVDRSQLKVIEPFWPGAVSLVVSCNSDDLAYLHRGKRSLAVRIPDNDQLLALLSETGPLMTTSANPPGKPTAHVIKTARDYFKDTVDFYIDGGDLSGNQPSTVVQIAKDGSIKVLRQGSATIKKAA